MCDDLFLFVHIIVQRCCCGWPGAGGTAGRGRPGMRMAAAPAPPAAASAARPACVVASFCSRWKKTKIYIKSNHSTVKLLMTISQCCGSGMFIPDLGSWFLPIPDPGSRIPDPGSKNSNREGWKKIFCHTFLCSHKFYKIENYFSFEVLKKKI